MKSNFNLDAVSVDAEIITTFESLEEHPQTKPIVLLNKEGIILYVNTILKKSLQLKEADSAYLLSSEPSIKSIINKIIEQELTSFRCELSVKTLNLEFINYTLELEKIVVDNEELYILQFDTQEKQNNISKQLNTYSKVLDSVNVGVMIANNEGKVKFTSSPFEKFLNKRIDELFNKPITFALENYLTTNELKELENSIDKKTKWIKVVSNISQEGDVFYKEIRLNILEDHSDRSINFLITANDITHQIRQTRLLKKSEQRQKSIINNIPDPLLIIRMEQNELIIENVNSSFYNNIELENIFVEEKRLREVVKSELFLLIKESVKKIEDSNRIHVQFNYTNAQRQKRFIGKVTYTDDHYDNSRLYIINLNDITEQLEIEKKLRQACENEISLNKLKSSFLANMSHEIRTPLNAIVGYSELLEDDVKAEDYESSTEMTSYLKDGVNRLLNLVDNIVEVSLLESGNAEIELSKISLNNIINTNKKKWNDLAEANGIEIDYNINDKEIYVKANTEKLAKALKEIISNAIKYNVTNGKVGLATTSNKKEVTIKIFDTGIGIDQDGLERIFKIFEQAEDEAYTRNYEGAGLGLSIANKLINFMNGNLNIISENNKGTTIIISLPQI
ncbi:MAG: PAS domain-containing sensor histidine kinase [Ignavibacteriae bacterium]|nr:PAS domain-containing sensor histidine kinase [Ignavibacteriota bacterium]